MQKVHANTGSVAQLSPKVTKAIHDAVTSLSRPGLYLEAYPYIEASRYRFKEVLARILGVKPGNISAQSSTSEALSKAFHQVCQRLPNPVMAYSIAAFSSVLAIALSQNQQGGVSLPIGEDNGLITTDHLNRMPHRPNVLILDWVNFRSGLVNRISPIINWCQKNDVILIVDAVQGLGAATIDFDINQIDFFACAGHKWLGSPEGAGFLHIGERFLDSTWPTVPGGASLLEYLRPELGFAKDARIQETGTLSSLSFLGLEAALLELEQEGYSNRVEKIRRNQAAVAELLICHPGICLVPIDGSHGSSGIISFWQEGVPTVETTAHLARLGVSARERNGVVRLSPGHEVDIEALILHLAQFLEEI